MRIALGTTLLGNGLRTNTVDGIGTYTANLLKHLPAIEGARVTPFTFSRKAMDVGGDLASIPVGGFGSQSFGALLAGTSCSALQRMDVDVVHATDHLVPKVSNKPVVATLMDAMPLSHPEWVGYRFKALKNSLWKRSFQWANRIITISEFSKAEIVKWFGIPDTKIDVIYPGVDEFWFTPPDAETVELTQQALDLPDKFILTVGTLQPRKNIERLLDAHELLHPDTRREFPLLVVGRAGWGCERLIARLEAGAEQGVSRWLARVPDDGLKVLLYNATVFAMPSLYEGFGLPVLEAYAAGTPVIASDNSAMPEVSGGLAQLVSPLDVDAISAALKNAALDSQSSKRQTLRAHRQRVAGSFTWQRTAALTHKTFRHELE